MFKRRYTTCAGPLGGRKSAIIKAMRSYFVIVTRAGRDIALDVVEYAIRAVVPCETVKKLVCIKDDRRLIVKILAVTFEKWKAYMRWARGLGAPRRDIPIWFIEVFIQNRKVAKLSEGWRGSVNAEASCGSSNEA